MSELEQHAEMELRKAGLFDKDSDYDGAIGDAVMELVKVFAAQEHSGASAARIRNVFHTVAAFEPLCPLTGDDDEWMEVGEGVFQNVRCSRVFKGPNGAYDIDGKVFREANGSCYTCEQSHTPVTFPYTPKTEYVAAPQ